MRITGFALRVAGFGLRDASCTMRVSDCALRVGSVVSFVLYRLFSTLIVNESFSFEFLITLVKAGNLYYRPRYQVKPVNPIQNVPKWVHKVDDAL
jgi:hypothetical protein